MQLIGGALTRDQKLASKSPFTPRQLTLDGAQPSEKIQAKHAELKQQFAFPRSIDNENEEQLSDDEERIRIKTFKCKERIRRVDILTEDLAIQDIIMGVEKAKQSVKTKGLLDHGLDLAKFQARQRQIRDIIDNNDIYDVENSSLLNLEDQAYDRLTARTITN